MTSVRAGRKVEGVKVLDADELAQVRRRLADIGPWDDAVRLLRTLDAETSDHNATKVKCEVYGRTCQHIGEVIGWDRSQMRPNESLWDAMARCVVRYANRRGQTINSGR